MRGVKENLIGKKFGHLTVIQRGPNAKNRDAQWYCQCDCGNPNYDKNGKLSHELTCDKCKICFQKKAKVCGCYDH